ncbi:sigma-70 family RNA polymerase sigma factor [Sporolactobacillus shoreicorticis]|uniref:Sigma-70 family RNA polymerase sigma factor n=1 Tax=Sporolactobacillus shoreicorticis TaxID=1923877 RepID=A0ABW5S8T7_9BACL|nr:sigma-70 family RNA polymerase sigma factor [Sporolactobacillus shoreicorticis]MCO7128173.1 sigma-70 family RNA polymerase sigma factor [Sporolactobacillus shoreicorticis]
MNSQLENQARDDAFARRIRPHMAMMRRQCVRLAGNAWDGEDLFQRAMLKCFKAWQKRVTRTFTKAYLYRIISNTWIDEHRKVRVTEHAQESFDEIAACSEGKKTSEQFISAMKIVLERLNAKQRLVYLMQAGWGLTAPEIAKRLGETEGNVRVIYHRAKRRVASDQPGADTLPDERRLARYINAFQSGDPDRLLALYREEAHRHHVRESGFGDSGFICRMAA